MFLYDCFSNELKVDTIELAQNNGKFQCEIKVSGEMDKENLFLEVDCPKKLKYIIDNKSLNANGIVFNCPNVFSKNVGDVFIQLTLVDENGNIIRKSNVSYSPAYRIVESINADEYVAGVGENDLLSDMLNAYKSTNELCQLIEQKLINNEFVGKKGDKGDKGEIGEQGIEGIQGLQGETGEKGDKGDKGDKGEIGEQGIEGIQGLQGKTGNKGDNGDKGDSGEQGIEGIQGLQGETGNKGDKGDKGDSGMRGIQGVQGLKGATGDKGEQGEQGIAGLVGEKGATGDMGEKGDRGDPGSGTVIKIKDIEQVEFSPDKYLKIAEALTVSNKDGLTITGLDIIRDGGVYDIYVWGGISSESNFTITINGCNTGYKNFNLHGDTTSGQVTFTENTELISQFSLGITNKYTLFTGTLIYNYIQRKVWFLGESFGLLVGTPVKEAVYNSVRGELSSQANLTSITLTNSLYKLTAGTRMIIYRRS